MKHKLLAFLAVELLAGPMADPAHAITITIDPDIYATGTNLTNIFRGATLSWLTQSDGPVFQGASYNPTRSDVYAVPCEGNFACWPGTGPAAFGDITGNANTGNAWDYHECYLGFGFCGYRVLEISFSNPTRFVEISGLAIADETMIWAYDAAGNQIFEGAGFITQTPNALENSVIPLYRPQADIARVVAGSWASIGSVYEIRYSVPEPGTLALLGLGLAGLGFERRRKLN